MADTKKTIRLEIITPDASVFQGEVDFVLVRALDGDLGIMPSHAPLLASLQIWPLSCMIENHKKNLFVSGGFLEVNSNTVTIVTLAAELADQIDIKRAEEAKKRAENRLYRQAADLDVERAQLALHRALGRIKTVRISK
jgi:F-type H+-transporting ATPase subunit epsilon